MMASQNIWGDGNITIYFKGTRGIFGINIAEKGIALPLKGTLKRN